MRYRTPLVVCAALLGVGGLAAQQPAAAPARAILRGAVVAAEGGERIPFALVLLEPGYTQRFADDAGAFAFLGVSPGSYRLIVRQVGFTPFDSTLAVSPATPALRIEMRRVAVELRAITVAAAGKCVDPQPPDPVSSPDLAALFEQLRQNSERVALLMDQYPFRYNVVRRLTEQQRAGDQTVTDTVEFTSNARWPYAPGRVVTDDPDQRRGVRFVHLPMLADFADTAFQRSHCFRLSGLETADAREWIRLDFRAAERLREPDVDGSVYLDPRTLQVGHTFVALTHVERAAAGVSAWTADVRFREIRPNLIVIESMDATTSLPARPGFRTPQGRSEHQQLIRVQFLRALPASRDSARQQGEVPVRPP